VSSSSGVATSVSELLYPFYFTLLVTTCDEEIILCTCIKQ